MISPIFQSDNYRVVIGSMNIWTKLTYAMVVLHGDESHGSLESVPKSLTKNKSKYLFGNIAVYIYNLKDTNTKHVLKYDNYTPPKPPKQQHVVLSHESPGVFRQVIVVFDLSSLRPFLRAPRFHVCLVHVLLDPGPGMSMVVRKWIIRGYPDAQYMAYLPTFG